MLKKIDKFKIKSGNIIKVLLIEQINNTCKCTGEIDADGDDKIVCDWNVRYQVDDKYFAIFVVRNCPNWLRNNCVVNAKIFVKKARKISNESPYLAEYQSLYDCC